MYVNLSCSLFEAKNQYLAPLQPMKVWIGDSIVMTEGDAWRQKRKLMNKAFSVLHDR